jgi:hypothetical protein
MHDLTMAVPINICMLLIISLVIMVSDFSRWKRKKKHLPEENVSGKIQPVSAQE